MLLVAGTFLYRLHTLGWQRTTLLEFLRLGTGRHKQHTGRHTPQLDAPAAEAVQPVLISKLNTGLQLALVAVCIGNSWYGWPSSEAVWWVTGCTGLTTAASGGAYAWLMLQRIR